MFDYQAPKDDDSYRNYQSTQQFIKRYMIILPLAAICLYDMLLIRRNSFSNSREVKLVNKPFEAMVGLAISNRLVSRYKNYIYKQDTEETKLVKTVLKKLIESNNLDKQFPSSSIDDLKVTVIHNDTLAMFMNLDQRLFITIPVLKVAALKEEQLALLVAHELAHYLLDHQVHRLGKAIFVNKIYQRFIVRDAGFKDIYDPTKVEFKAKVTEPQRYSCFYPQQRLVTKFYEKNCDIFAHQLWKKAYGNHESCEEVVNEVYGRLERHIAAIPYLDQNELYHSTYTYNRLEVNRKIARAIVVE